MGCTNQFWIPCNAHVGGRTRATRFDIVENTFFFLQLRYVALVFGRLTILIQVVEVVEAFACVEVHQVGSIDVQVVRIGSQVYCLLAEQSFDKPQDKKATDKICHDFDVFCFVNHLAKMFLTAVAAVTMPVIYVVINLAMDQCE